MSEIFYNYFLAYLSSEYGWWRYVKWEKGDDGGIYLIRIVKVEIFPREKEEAKHDMIKMCMSINTMG